ncbi:hypothetical protein [Propionicimonas sp.]
MSRDSSTFDRAAAITRSLLGWPTCVRLHGLVPHPVLAERPEQQEPA